MMPTYRYTNTEEIYLGNEAYEGAYADAGYIVGAFIFGVDPLRLSYRKGESGKRVLENLREDDERDHCRRIGLIAAMKAMNEHELVAELLRDGATESYGWGAPGPAHDYQAAAKTVQLHWNAIACIAKLLHETGAIEAGLLCKMLEAAIRKPMVDEARSRVNVINESTPAVPYFA